MFRKSGFSAFLEGKNHGMVDDTILSHMENPDANKYD